MKRSPLRRRTALRRTAWVTPDPVRALIRRRLRAPGQLPAWADCRRILQVYVLARDLRHDSGQPWVVDHLVPLRGELGSGLHVAGNLVVRLREDNGSKGASFNPGLFIGP